MATFKEYTKKNGEKAWLFRTYLGVNEVTGKKVMTTRRGFTTKKEAQKELNKLLVDYEKNGLQKKVTYTFQQIYDDWIKQYENTVKESTFAKTKQIFKHHILPFFGNMKIDKIEVKHCQEAINLWAKRMTIDKRAMNYTGRVFDYAIRIGLISTNPTKLIIKPVRKESHEEKEVNFYTKEELSRFFECLEKEGNPKIYALFRLLAFTGMRKGEALALTWSDIDFDNKAATVSKTLTRGENSRLIVQTPKTANSKRVVSLDDKTISILKQWRNTQRKAFFGIGFNTRSKQQLIFSNSDNEYMQPTVTRKYIQRLSKKYGIKVITTHGFRHTHCSLLFEAGASIKEVQDRLGHSDIQTTMNIYAHVSQDRKDKTANLFAEYVSI